MHAEWSLLSSFSTLHCFVRPHSASTQECQPIFDGMGMYSRGYMFPPWLPDALRAVLTKRSIEKKPVARGSTRLLVRPNPATRQGARLPAAARWLRNFGPRGLRFESGCLYTFTPRPQEPRAASARKPSFISRCVRLSKTSVRTGFQV